MAADPSPPPGAERDLLLGVLALQLDFVGTTDLREALRAWAADRSRPLGRLLVARCALAPRRLSLLTEIVAEYLVGHDMNVSQALTAACTARVLPVDLAGLTAAAQCGNVPTLPSSPGTIDGPHSRHLLPAAAEPPASNLRFRVLRPHARGALGVVYVAVDEELHREVALKEIQAPNHRSPDSRARFLQEAEITGSLEHPGVVPVYSLNCHPDGRPYYAMRFIKGESLHEAITRFHQADAGDRDGGERALALRGLLTRFVAVCNAVAYAHSRGVIHRDLKPSNIMLGPFGETLVVDWGLAKALDQPDVPPSAEGTIHPSITHGAEATQLGQAVGTPAFMSPEQAAGRLDAVGPASDVYSLGATLYHLLTGLPAFPGYDVTEVLKQVLARDFPPPRRVKPQVPPALEAVVLRAMEEKPDQRYPSAAALAEEVERWLADEPVSAYPEPLRKRAGRWARRNRTLVSGLVALLLTALFGLGVGLFFVNRERDRARQNLARAEANLDLARRAVDECFLVAVEDPLLQKDRMSGVRRLLLRKALPFYQGFQSQRPDDRSIQMELGTNHFRVAFITAEVGRKAEALESYEQARRVFADLVERYPDDENYRIDLARVCNNLGALQSEAGLREQALASYEQARLLRKELAADGRRPELRAELANTLTNLGQLLAQTGKPEEARDYYVEAAALQRTLTEPRYRADLAATLNNLGIVLAERKDERGAAHAYREARELREKLAAADRESARSRADLADTLVNEGALFSETGRAAEARENYERARDLFAAVAAEYSEVTEYRSGLANALMNLGDLLSADEEPAAALAAYREAEKLLRQLVGDLPEVGRYAVDLAGTSVGLAELQREPAEALPLYGRALELLARAGELPATRQLARRAHAGRAEALDRLGRHREAVADWAAASERADSDERAYYRVGRATSLALAGDHDGAMAELRRLDKGKSPSGERLYSLACVAALSSAAAGRDAALSAAERGRRAGDCAAAAVGLLERAWRAGLFADAEMAAHLKKDADLNALRGRDDFKSLLGRVEKMPGGR